MPQSVGRDVTERARSARWLAGVVRMIDAVHHGHLGEVEWAYPVEASDVHGMEVWIGSTLMMGIYAAAGTEEMLHCSGVEAIGGQHVLALEDIDPAHFRHDDDGAAHPAVGAIAAADRAEAVTERHFEVYCTAMASTRPNVRISRHDMPPIRIASTSGLGGRVRSRCRRPRADR